MAMLALQVLLLAPGVPPVLPSASATAWTECPGISHVKNGDCNSPNHPCKAGSGMHFK